MYTKFLDPTNYVAIKRLFGTEINKDILIHFLNAVTVFKTKHPIREVEFLQPLQDPEISYRRTSIVDVLCKDAIGNNYIIQIYPASTSDFEKNAQIYAAKAYCSEKNKYLNLKEIVFLVIADFVIYPDKKKFKSDHVILNPENQELKNFSFTFLELPKFTKNIDKLSTPEEKWCYFFKHANETTAEELQKIIHNDVIIEKAYKELDSFYWSPEALQSYETSEKSLNDYLSSLDYAFEQGKAIGRALAIAKNMLRSKIPVKTVVKVTGLDLEEFKKIQAEVKKTSSKSPRLAKARKKKN